MAAQVSVTREDVLARVRRLLAVEYSEDRHCPPSSAAEEVTEQMLATLLAAANTPCSSLTFDELVWLAAHDVDRRSRE
jgi:hypothetical protein